MEGKKHTQGKMENGAWQEKHRDLFPCKVFNNHSARKGPIYCAEVVSVDVNAFA